MEVVVVEFANVIVIFLFQERKPAQLLKALAPMEEKEDKSIVSY
jgi:hypothetical protein